MVCKFIAAFSDDATGWAGLVFEVSAYLCITLVSALSDAIDALQYQCCICTQVDCARSYLAAINVATSA
ncbi:MAG: hypothetical protein CVT87_04805 [Alphaproteobacteria bacterium HGW-Alphaproteobacteria-9]|nr:MAG: hypothetical protein CVT87_04805 [Alphaproteobacteria bacterium HGW-Alphaproteobacteria-9]